AASRVIVLDGRPESADGADPILGAALARARARGLEVEVVRGDAVAGHLLDDLAPTLRTNTVPTLVLALQLQRVAAMQDEVPNPTDEFGPGISGATALRDVTMHGSTNDIHVIGWWPNLRALTTNLTFDHGG